MPRLPKLSWHELSKAWRANAGPVSPKSGRRNPVYFRNLPETPKGEREAGRLLEEYVRERDRREAAGLVDQSNPLVEQVVESYLEHCDRLVARGKLEERTRQTHAERLGTFMSFSPTGRPQDRLGERRARDIRVVDLRRLRDAMEEAHRSPHYINGIIRSAKACWAWASHPDESRTPERILASDPFKGFKGPKLEQAVDNYATRAEVARMLRVAWRDVNRWTVQTKGRCAACTAAKEETPCRRGHNPSNLFGRATVLLIRIAYGAGCRPGELCKARWPNWHPPEPGEDESGMIVMRKHKTSGKTAKPREILVLPPLIRALERWRSRPVEVKGDHIFGHRRGKNWKAVGASDARVGQPWNSTALGLPVRKWRRKAGVREDVTMYTMRHTYATDALHAGLSNAAAGAVISTGERVIESSYGHFQRRERIAAARLISGSRRGKRGGAG